MSYAKAAEVLKPTSILVDRDAIGRYTVRAGDRPQHARGYWEVDIWMQQDGTWNAETWLWVQYPGRLTSGGVSQRRLSVMQLFK